MSERVIIDTDPGIDDALAIVLALQSRELQISAITTVSGNVPVEVATRNVFRIMSLIPSSPRFPVAQGAPKPLQKKPVYATGFHGDDGLGGLDRLRDNTGSPRYPVSSRPIRAAMQQTRYFISLPPHRNRSRSLHWVRSPTLPLPLKKTKQPWPQPSASF